METTSVTSRGQVTIPKTLRQQLGLRQGSKVEFVLLGDRVEMRVVSTGRSSRKRFRHAQEQTGGRTIRFRSRWFIGR